MVLEQLHAWLVFEVWYKDREEGIYILRSDKGGCAGTR